MSELFYLMLAWNVIATLAISIFIPKTKKMKDWHFIIVGILISWLIAVVCWFVSENEAIIESENVEA